MNFRITQTNGQALSNGQFAMMAIGVILTCIYVITVSSIGIGEYTRYADCVEDSGKIRPNDSAATIVFAIGIVVASITLILAVYFWLKHAGVIHSGHSHNANMQPQQHSGLPSSSMSHSSMQPMATSQSSMMMSSLPPSYSSLMNPSMSR
jgi:hypothetical protein